MLHQNTQQQLFLVFSIACSEQSQEKSTSPQHWPCVSLFSRRCYFSGQQPRGTGQSRSSSRCYDACSSAPGLANEAAEPTEHESTNAKPETVACAFIFFIMFKTGLCCRLSKTREKIFKNTDRCLLLFREREEKDILCSSCKEHKACAQIDLPQSFAPRSSPGQCIQLDL